MRHIDELTLMMYADNELPQHEHRHVSEHLAVCPTCQQGYMTWITDDAFLQRMEQSENAVPALNLSPFVREQIEAIAVLHSQRTARAEDRGAKLLLFLLGMVFASFLILGNSILSVWERLWSIWQEKILWKSLFWLSQNIYEIVTSFPSFLPVIVLSCASLLIGLIFLNTRDPAGRYTHQ